MSSRRSFLKQFSGLVAVSAAKVSEVEHPQIDDELREELEGSTYTPPTFELSDRFKLVDLVPFKANGSSFLARVESMQFMEVAHFAGHRPDLTVELKVVIPFAEKTRWAEALDYFEPMVKYDLEWARTASVGNSHDFGLPGAQLVRKEIRFDDSELRVAFRGATSNRGIVLGALTVERI